MATYQLDLWPVMTATTTTQNTPVSILRDQAALLEKKTDGLVIADVKRRNVEVPEIIYAVTKAGVKEENAQNVFAYSLLLNCASVGKISLLAFLDASSN